MCNNPKLPISGDRRIQIPLVLRLPPTPGVIIGLLFGGLSTIVVWRNDGAIALHGLWITGLLISIYYFLRDYFMLRCEVNELRSAGNNREIIRFESGDSPHETDFSFKPDEKTEENITKEKCDISISRDIIKIIRPQKRGRYIATLRHYVDGNKIPLRNVISRKFRVSFSYKTSGPPYSLVVRLRNHKLSWEKQRDGKACAEPITLRETEWAKSPPILLEPSHPGKEFVISLELMGKGDEPSSDHYLLLRNLRVSEDF